ncbi:MAG: hypothetical protein IJR60_02990 [Eubacterium sp.]|nr:hypothetical protein [Eubacterium sp.]
MKSMGFNFIKRAVIIPLVLAVIAAALVLAAVKFAPERLTEDQNEQTTYSVQEVQEFSKLQSGDYVGRLVFADGTERAVTFDESTGNTLVLLQKSKEPWKNGSAVIRGTGVSAQLGELRHLKQGDTFTFDIGKRGGFEYEITDVASGVSAKDASAYTGQKGKAKMLYLCRSYNDFSSADKTKLYVVYTARQIGGGNG